MALSAEEYQEKYGHLWANSGAAPEQGASSTPYPERDAYEEKYGHLWKGKEYKAPEDAVDPDEDPTWADYGRIFMSGGAQIGSGIGWLFNSTDWGKELQTAGQDAAQWWLEDLSPQARAALQVEFTKRDRGELWTDAKWNKAKLTAMQSLLGTAAGMGVGSVLTKGLGAAGMSKAVTTAAGTTVQAPTKVAGAIGYGLGEAGIAAPSVGASVDSEIMQMSHEDLYANAADYRAIYDGLENADPAVRAERAKKILADAAAGDASMLALASTFVLSAPFGSLMSKMTAGLPLTAGGGRLAGGARGAAGEAGQEFLQSGAEKMAENIGMRQADPSRGITEGALEEAVGGAMAGGIMGAGPGLAANPEMAPVGPALEDEDSPLAALAGTPVPETDIDPETGKPVLREEPDDELSQTLDKVLDESSQIPDKDELETTLEDAYLELGIVTKDTEAKLAEQAQIAADEAALEQAAIDLEQEMQEGSERRAQQLPVLENDRDRQIQAQKEKAFAQKEQADQKARQRKEKDIEAGFSELEAQRREEEYQRQIALGEAGGVGTNRFEGTSLGEAIQSARQDDEDDGGGPPPAAPITRGVPELGVPEPEYEYVDERLRDPVRRSNLEKMRDELTPGGGITLVPDQDFIGGESDKRNDDGSYEAPLKRTQSTNPEWFQNMAASGEIPSVRWAWNAVDKALAGKRLGVKQKRVVQAMLDEAQGAEEFGMEEAERDLRYATKKRPEFQLTQEQDGVVPEKPKQPEQQRKEVDADLGVPGDLFSTEANKQTDLVTETRATARKEAKDEERIDKVEKVITRYARQEGKTPEDVKEAYALIEELANEGNPRASSLLHELDFQQMDDDGYGTYPKAKTTDPRFKKGASKGGRVEGVTGMGVNFRQGQRENSVSLEDITYEADDAQSKYRIERMVRIWNKSHPTNPVKGSAEDKARRAAKAEEKQDTKEERTEELKIVIPPTVKGITQARLKRIGTLLSANPELLKKKPYSDLWTYKPSPLRTLNFRKEDGQIRLMSVDRTGLGGPTTSSPPQPGSKKTTHLKEALEMMDKDLQLRARMTPAKTTPAKTTPAKRVKEIEFKVPPGTEYMFVDDAEQYSDPGIPLPLLESQEGPYLDNLEAQIRKEGWKEPIKIVKNPPNGKPYIYDGHHRLAIAIRNNLPEVPVEWIDNKEAKGVLLDGTEVSDSGFVIDEKKFNEVGPDTVERVFESTVNPKTRKGIDIKLKNAGNEYISPEEADRLVTEWEDHAIAQSEVGAGRNDFRDNSNRVIISLFDTTGTWANPYALAGYDVRALDIKDGIDVTDFSTQFMDEMFNNFDGKEIYGIIAACPCTTFSNSATKWRRSDLPADHPRNRHENADPEYSRKWIAEMWGKEAAEARDPDTGEYTYATPHDYAIALVHKTMQTLEYFRPKFWALENPEGRIESAAGLPGPWRTGFQPSNFGDPYTKRTLLWGEFNEDLPTANVDPVEGSKMHKMSPSEDRQAARSETPVGFSYAFFMANNFLDTDPVERTKKDYWYVAGAIEEAFRAGVTEEQIREEVYLEEAYDPDNETVEATLEQLRELIAQAPGKPASPEPPPAAAAPVPEETEEEREAQEEREAIQSEQAIEDEADEVGDIPGWDDIETEAATMPGNDLDHPSKAQKEAGNYKKAHITIKRMPITIENPAGSSRNGQRQPAHYGYIRLTEGKDGDHLDVFVNPKIQTDYNNKVFVIDQMNQQTGQFDEHKVMLGYTNQLAAVRDYKRAYGKDWKVGPVTAMDMATFKKWTQSRAKLTRPASEDAFFGEQSRLSGRAAKGKGQDLKDVGRDLRYATKKRQLDLFEGGRNAINAPNEKYIKAVLAAKSVSSYEYQPSQRGMRKLVSQVVALREQRKDLDKQAAPPAPPKRVRSVETVERETQEVRAGMPGANVQVLESYKAAPADISAQMEADGMTDVTGLANPETGEIYLFADRIDSAEEAVRIVVHESAHIGLRTAFGYELDGMLGDLYENVPEQHKAALQEIVDGYKLDTTNEADRLEAAEELLAHIAETEPKNSFVQEAIAKIRQLLRAMGVSMGEWTDAEIISVIKEARGSLARRKDRIAGVTFDEDVIVDETGEVFTVEQNAEEVLLQLEKRKGVLEKVKGCL